MDLSQIFTIDNIVTIIGLFTGPKLRKRNRTQQPPPTKPPRRCRTCISS